MCRCLIRMVCIIMTRRPIFALPLPVLHHTTGLSPVPPQLLVRVQHQRNWALHISVHHHVESYLLSHKHRNEDSDSPFHIFYRRPPERYVPSGQHLLLPNYDLYHLDVSTCHSSVGFPLGVSSRTLYTLPHRMDA